MIKDLFWGIFAFLVYIAVLLFEGISRLILTYCIGAGFWLAMTIHTGLKLSFVSVEMVVVRVVIFFATFIWFPTVYKRVPWFESFGSCEQKLRNIF